MQRRRELALAFGLCFLMGNAFAGMKICTVFLWSDHKPVVKEGKPIQCHSLYKEQLVTSEDECEELRNEARTLISKVVKNPVRSNTFLHPSDLVLDCPNEFRVGTVSYRYESQQ